MKKLVSAILAVSVLLLSAPTQARAESELSSRTVRQAKVVGRGALYGFGGGLVVGLASQVFKHKAKNILVCGSLGMYAGILLGIYVISTSPGPKPYEGPDTYEDFSQLKPVSGEGLLAQSGASMRANANANARAQELKLNLLNLSF